MAWIKRNLFFFIGSLVALALMAGGGFFLYQQISDESGVAAKIAEQYASSGTIFSGYHGMHASRDSEKAIKSP